MITIIGAGPVGLTLGCLLQQYGVQSQIIERKTKAGGHETKAIVVWTGAMQVLASIGVAEALRQLGTPIAKASYFSGDKPVASITTEVIPETDFAGPLSIPQPVVEKVLRERYKVLGGSLVWGETVVEMSLGPRSASVRTDKNHVFESNTIIGADGLGSTVRRLAGIELDSKTYEEWFFLADGTLVDQGFIKSAEYYMNSPVSCVRVALPEGRTRIFLMGRKPIRVSPKSHESTEQFVHRILSETPYSRFRFSSVDWHSEFVVRRALAKRYVSGHGRVVLCGDAAHVHSPAGGQGMNTGIQDAHSLAWRLASIVLRGGDRDVELSEYESERTAVARGVIRQTDAQIRSWGLRSPLLIRARDLVLKRAATNPVKLLTTLSQVAPVRKSVRASGELRMSMGEVVRRKDWAELQQAVIKDTREGESVTYDLLDTGLGAGLRILLTANHVKRLTVRPDFVVTDYEGDARS